MPFVLWELSYTNAIMYLATIPKFDETEFEEIDETGQPLQNQNGAGNEIEIDAETPEGRNELLDFLSSAG